MKSDNSLVAGSFRDPSGFLFRYKGALYRQINKIYREHYDHLMNSGLYEKLVEEGLLIPHKEVDIIPPKPEVAYKVIKPQEIPFVSYPYEWCFSQLKDAALTTLKIQKTSLEFGMSLKDASAYNIQFKDGRPILIDTLSFERYQEGRPWVAYRQFCQHFLAPLALMALKDARLGSLSRIYLDGIPLDLASKLLPFRAFFRLALLGHLHFHAKSQQRLADKTVDAKRWKLGRLSLIGLIESLEKATRKLRWKQSKTVWSRYYDDHANYSAEAFEHKKRVVTQFIEQIRPKTVWDLGANVGIFSRIASDRKIFTVAFDMDYSAVETNYLACCKKREPFLLPLVIDLTNPSPSIGWGGEERMSLQERGPADAVLALALIHHLAIDNNTPLDRIADFLSAICHWLIIEFVPKDDPQVQRLLSSRDDIFSDYSKGNFEAIFSSFFSIEASVNLKDSLRTIYLMRRRQIKQ